MFARTAAAGLAASAAGFQCALAAAAATPPAPPPPRKDFVATCGSGQFGQLGLGNEKDEAGLKRIQEHFVGSPLRSVVSGGQNTAVVAANGDLFTFGNGKHGRLGHGNDSSQTVPQRVDLAGVKMAACGEYHMAAVNTKGEVFTWGKKRCPQLGQSDGPNYAPGIVGGIPAVQAIDCGRQQTVAVTASGEVYTWGYGREGSLGHGNKSDVSTPTAVASLKGVKVTDVVCGREFTFVTTKDGKVFSWGSNDFGQLGSGDDSSRYQLEPKPVKSLASHQIVQIACGELHACALTSTGELYTWGCNKDGQLGHGTKQDASLPQRVEYLHKEGVTIRSVACGSGHTAAIDTEGRVWVFGRGRNGQLCRGDQLESIAAYRNSPILAELSKLGDGVEARQVVCGADHTALLASASE